MLIALLSAAPAFTLAQVETADQSFADTQAAPSVEQPPASDSQSTTEGASVTAPDTMSTQPDPAISVDTSAIDDSAASDADISSVDATAAKGTIEQPMAMMGAGEGNTSPTISAPNVLSTQNAQPKVDGSTGALTFRIPLDIPPGRNGMQPDLALVYNSQSTQDSIAGYGWDLSIPSIVRVNKYGSNTLYSAGVFSSTLDGELATSSNGVYRGRVDESRRTYSYSGNTWTVYDKNGTRYLFGSASQSQLAATTSPSNVYRWLLDEIRDTNDNYVRFTYTRDGNQLYPDTITYTGHGQNDGIFTVTFAKSSRPDPYVDYRPGFKVTTSYRISQITANVNGSMVRQHSLGYSSGNNGYRSLLHTIQEIGSGDSGTTTLPPITLSYVSTTTQFVTPHPTTQLQGPAWISADVNGNGRSDVTVFYQSSGGSYASVFAPDNQNSNSSITPPDYWSTWQNANGDTHPSIERGVRFLDTNADGKADIIGGYYNYTNATATNELLLNTYSATSSVYAWTSTTTGVSSIPVIDYDGSGSLHNLSTGIFSDVNADGLPDYELRVDVGGGPTTGAYLGTGSGWSAATTSVFSPPFPFPVSTPSPTNSQLVDINSDGLPDWVYSDGTQTYVLLNTATGWESSPDPTWTIATSTLFNAGSNTYYDRGIRFADINGDGLPDFLHAYSGSTVWHSASVPIPEVASYAVVLLNTGAGWATSTAYSLSPIAMPVAVSGSTDVWGGSFMSNEYGNWIGNGQMQQDVVSTILYPKGGSSSVVYAYSTQTASNSQLPYELLTVASLINHDGNGSNEETDYSYSGGQQYYPTFNLPDRKFAGFASTTVTTPLSIATTYYHQNDGVATSLSEQNDGYAQINHPYREDIFSTGGTLLRKTLRKWDTLSHGNVSFLAITRQLIQDFAADGSHRDSATEYAFSTSTDDLLQTDQFGEVNANGDGTFADTGSDLRSTAFTYAASTTINLSVLTEKILSIPIATTTATATTSARVLVIGGGGGGGHAANTGGGGGAGGYQYDAAHVISGGTYTITVGAGGAGGNGGNGYNGLNGGNSVFDTMTAVGGGGGGGNGYPGNGGSGGGGQGYNCGGGCGSTTGGTGSQGSSGGNGKGSANYGGGGGGGASTTGSNGTDSGGNGGAGIANNISGATTTYAGGGGGTAWSGGSGSGGSGGTGGGGNGDNHSSAGGSAGTANTGGGGGAGQGYAGGSGVVIIAAPLGTITASGGTHTTAGSNDVWTFSTTTSWTVSAVNGTSTAVAQLTISDQKIYYDGLAFGSVASGNQTRRDDWKTGTSYASSTATYNSFGLVATSTDRNGKSTSYVYDTYNLYPATTTNALSQTTAYTYNYSNGQVVQTVDPNGRLSKKMYDGVGRVIETDQSDTATPATLVALSTFTYTDNSTPPTIVKSSNYLTATTTIDSYTFTDGLGREIQKRSQNNAGTYTTTDKSYDSAGMLHSTSLPYFSSGTALTSATTAPALLTTYAYDALGRSTSVADIFGTATSSYAKWTTTSSDKNGHVRDFTKDAFGNLVQVIEHANASNYTTTYAYDVLGNLATTTDASGNVRTFGYDGLSRRVSATDLHATADGTYGTYSYAYDDGGNLVQTVDPKAQTITRAYDALGRLITEDFTGASGTEITLTYDACANGIGLLCVASSTDAKITNAYDILGRVSSATTTTNGLAYPVATTYDRQSNIVSQRSPSGALTAYAYGAGGRISSIAFTPSSGASSTIASNITYAPTGAVAGFLSANGVQSAYAYDPTKLYRLSTLSAIAAAATSTATTTARVLVIGGGGGGGNAANTGGGGGAGGYLYDAGHVITPTTYAITIGAGGAGGNSGNGYNGLNGSNSVFDTMTAIGGGGGGGNGYPGNGGSGGGGQGYNCGGGCGSTTGGTGSQGSAGGNGKGTANYGGGGGGGAAAAGSNGDTNGGNGGAGIANNISGATTTYAGGGGGTAWSGAAGTGGSGGTGGGGNGDNHSSTGGAAGTANTGGGGGAGQGYAGGSGVVIIAAPLGTITASGGTHTTSGSNDVWTFTTNGTFTVTAVSGASSTPAIYRSISYVYDPVGNITQIDDTGANGTRTTTAYSYDNLDRLLAASTTYATSNPYSLSYTYDPLGSLLSTIGTTTTTYSYGQTGYANPHAPTSVGGVSYTYDNNGNATLAGSASYAYDYLNRMTRSIGSATTTYGYDFGGRRVFQTTGATSTLYIDRIFSVATSTATTTAPINSDYIFLGDQLIAQADQPAYLTYATATPALVASTTNSSTTSLGTTTRQWPIATSTASDRLLTLFANIKQSTAGSGCISSAYLLTSTGTTTLTKATSTRISNMQTEAWYLVNPPSASSTITIVITGTTTEFKLSAALFSGIAQSNPIDVIAGKLGTNGSPSITATTTAASDLILTTLTRDGSTDATSTRTSLYKLRNGILGAGSYTVASTTTGYTDTYTGTATANWGMLSIALKAATSTIGTTPTISYVHTDHLGSTIVVTDASGTVVQTLDYYPYGAERINSGTKSTDREFIGERYDRSSGLSYLNARYYEGSRGQFLSEDPVFLEVGGPLRGENLQAFLANPQALNSYSYAENNPIIRKDPSGRCAGPFIFVCLGVIGANLGIWTNYAGGVLEKQAQGDSNPYQFDMTYRQLGTSAGLGAFELAALPENRAIGGIYSFSSSLADDRAAGNQANYPKAFVSAGTSVIAGTFFKNLVGNVPASLVARSQITNQVFQNASVLVTNNAAGTNTSIPFQTAQSAAKAAGIGNTGSGTFIGTYNFGAGVGTFNFGTGTWVNAQSTPATIK